MALTPEQVKTQNFNVTKFRDGYDPDQVDDFLDQVEADLRARDAEKAELERQIAKLQEELKNAKNAAPVPANAAAAKPAAPAPHADAQQSTAMLQMALELHDKYVSEGESKHRELVSNAEVTAKKIVGDAETERNNIVKALEVERGDLKKSIEKLREFENEYRSTLKSYIQGQLRDLEGSSVVAGAETDK